jgi:hypothetical protein
MTNSYTLLMPHVVTTTIDGKFNQWPVQYLHEAPFMAAQDVE